jgi:pyrroloquinoline quinone biosynthesis protein B
VKIRVLGSCAGGGLPQWNCGADLSARARSGALAPRSQASIAISVDGERWSILNASPDIRQQMAAFPGLHPRPGTRDVPLDTVVLTNAELDHALGLLILRESMSYRIVTTPWVRDALVEHNSAWRMLEPAWGAVKLDTAIPLDRDGRLQARFFPTAGKVPKHLAELATNHPEASVGVRIFDTKTHRRLVFAPGLAALDSGTLAELEEADCRFVDGTFFSPDELLRIRPGAPDAVAMGHLPITGEDSSLATLAALPGRTVYIHMNNTNPILDEDSPEAARVRCAGIEIAVDGMEIET